MKKFACVNLVILALLLSAGPAPAKTFYLRDGSAIEYKRVWKKGNRIFLLVNRDTLLEFSPEEVDQARTLKAGKMKRFPRLAAKKGKTVSASVPTKPAPAAPAPALTKPASVEQ